MREMEIAQREMPLYKCHKEVWALKIKVVKLAPPPTISELDAILNNEEETPIEILPSGEIRVAVGVNTETVGATLVPEDSHYAEFTVSREYLFKHKPIAGGYYVRYKDGYESFSPALAFEEGYALKR